jgi:beta-glucosidase-like glycosyl hydrolase/CubicO group peptidase (beta-lactamase class C family)
MMKIQCIAFALMVLLSQKSMGQLPGPAATLWADSVFATLSDDERIAQLMVIRTSSPGKDGKAVFYDSLVDLLVKKYNVGGVCLFQGTPLEQAALLNRIQKMAKTPIMVTVDAEWGLGMRFAGVKSFPYQLTMGATNDAELVYRVGKAMADQCRRMNIHVNYAPVVDINNNPKNPVIGYRSFGENREKVALYGTRIMLGMQDNGIMACAKHFPGHGDVDVDSHYDLPIINKSLAQLDSLELYPFKALFKAGIASVMVAHLSIPAIDNTANRATSLSYNNVTSLMREQLGYNGLTFTDALEMKGVAKFFPSGEAAVESLIAGNDMLCLPGDVPTTIETIKKAIADGKLSWENVNNKCRRVLISKYDYVNGKSGEIDIVNLEKDLNSQVPVLRKAVAEKALTFLQMESGWKPLSRDAEDVILVQVGGRTESAMAAAMRARGAQVFLVPLTGGGGAEAIKAAKKKSVKAVIVSVQGLGRNPANNFGLGDTAIQAISKLANMESSTLVLLGNPYALGALEKAAFKNIAVAYEDDAIFQNTAYDWLTGIFQAEGTLPVSIGKWQAGDGIVGHAAIPRAAPATMGMNAQVLAKIEAIARQGIDSAAYPGCVVTVLRKGALVYQQSFGFTTYEQTEPVGISTVYDMASVTKTSATTMAVMKLYEDGLLDLDAPVSKYLPWLRGSDKADITIKNMLLHQSGLVAWIPFYKEVVDADGVPKKKWFASHKKGNFKIPVTEKLYMKKRWQDTMYSRIKTSKLTPTGTKYVYSDNNFILMARVVKSITGKSIDAYAAETFYQPLGLATTGYKAFQSFDLRQIAPTENEKVFRRGLLWGYVHDPGAAMFGNVAGHAGLFSNATDLASLYQMALNGGKLGSVTLLKKETIDKFTSYNSDISRRGYGFDKPEKGNDTLAVAKQYPAAFVSPATYGHTGYTGICVWVDPTYDLVYIFFSNRVHPGGGENLKLSRMNIRSRIQDVIYESMRAPS